MSNTETERTKALRNIGPSSIVTVDNVPAEDVVSLKVYVDSAQDLHGYDHPWPAGGGKNKLQITATSGTSGATTYTVDSAKGSIKFTGTRSSNTAITINSGFTLPAGTYVASCVNSTLNFYLQILKDNTRIAYADNQTNSTFTLIETATLTATIFIRGNVDPNGITLYPQIEAGSTASSFAPYSNICPISGRTGAKVTRTGKNLAEKADDFIGNLSVNVDDDGTLTINGTSSTYCYIRGNFNCPDESSTYTWALFNPNVVAQSGVEFSIRDRNPLYSAGGWDVVNTPYMTKTFVPDSGKKPVYWRFQIAPGITFNNAVFKPMIVLGNSAPEIYESYEGTTYPISWQSEAGTVYGGTLDVTNGTLTVDRAMVVFDGSSDEEWSFFTFQRMYRAYIAVSDIDTTTSDASIADIVSNQFSAIPYNRPSIDMGISARFNIAQINVFQNEYTTLAEWKSYLASNPLQVVYKLATPITYQLTQTQITLLAGVNNVWADCGDILKMRYWSYDLLLNKVVYDNNTLIDLTGDTITPEVMLAGYTAHDATGSEIEGSIEIATMAEVQTYFGLS